MYKYVQNAPESEHAILNHFPEDDMLICQVQLCAPPPPLIFNWCLWLYCMHLQASKQEPSSLISDLHTSLSDHTLSLGMKESQSEGPNQPLPIHPRAHTIGAPLEAGKQLFTDLQNTYINE